jgi:vancomycin resistance protein YoaR
VREDGKILRATVEGKAADGQVYDADAIADDVIAALTQGENSVTRNVTAVKGAILYDDGTKTHVLTELGVGRSEFASSPIGRKKNVRKAMNEKANGIVIPQGTTFSFNSTLGGPITYSNGWYESLIIVNGRDLEPAPGGGICQSSTTVFRAAVAAGLPIVFRKSHSLYVTYYKQYGVGLDAAVFPGKQDLTFENDTQGPVVLLGMTDDEDNAYSTLYGIDDDRTVMMDGPYFGYTRKEPVMGRTLRNNQVGWVQRVTKPDGTTREELLVAQYLQLPKSVALEFTPQTVDAASLLADIR